tara:strand:- start:733 stop:963 length:231 start_codon:yes stop_codon:yes gene_type:complete
MDKLGLYINNLMTTIIDKEEKVFLRKLAFTELLKLKSDVSDFLARYVDKFDGIPDELKEKDTRQLSIEFGEKHEDK